jgi:hypothetical protein
MWKLRRIAGKLVLHLDFAAGIGTLTEAAYQLSATPLSILFSRVQFKAIRLLPCCRPEILTGFLMSGRHARGAAGETKVSRMCQVRDG